MIYRFDFIDRLFGRRYGMGYVRRHGVAFCIAHQYTADKLDTEIREQLLELGRLYYRGQVSLDAVKRCLPDIYDDFEIFARACDAYKSGILDRIELNEIKERYLLEAGNKMYERRLFTDVLCSRLLYFAGYGRAWDDND